MKLKIGFIRFPQAIYDQGLAIKGGSEIANQQLISFLIDNDIEVVEFSPVKEERLKLYGIPVIGTTLMFQELAQRADEINQCDIVFTSHWFNFIIPEITVPVITLFHHNAALVVDIYNNNPVPAEKKVFDFWLNKLQSNDALHLGEKSHQNLHDMIISIGEKNAIENSKKSVAVSQYLKKTLVESYSAQPENIQVIYNSNPPDWQNKTVEKDFSQKELKLVSVTRLPDDIDGYNIKGIDRTFEIFSRVTGVTKRFIASTKNSNYKQFLTENLPDVEFFENADRSKLFDLLQECHISFHCSRCESFGLTLTESMLLGNVPVTFPVGVASELITDGENGFIVNSVEEALEKISFLNENRSILETVSRNARTTVLNQLDPKKIMQSYLSLINQIIK